VNVDEELANLTVYQNSYQAAARVMTTANALLEALLAIQ
jgi:flagellar hook-associated protein FlgK